MANIVRKWRRVMAVGCSHGDLINPSVKKQILAFRERYQPEIRFDLGDLVDTAAFRSGARGTPDEGREIAPDFTFAVRWIEQYEPTHITWGNHCWRLVELSNSPNAIVAHAAGSLWNDLSNAARKVKAKTKEYDFEHGWFEMGGHYWGHGYWYNELAVRDHAEYLGGPVVMAHLHVPQQVPGRTRKRSDSFCVGLLADKDKMLYARRRRATSRWAAGCVFGEITDGESHLWLAKEQNGTLHFPL